MAIVFSLPWHYLVVVRHFQHLHLTFLYGIADTAHRMLMFFVALFSNALVSPTSGHAYLLRRYHLLCCL